jgi:peptidoglycan/LPS O-acetylase OafA/YrhL
LVVAILAMPFVGTKDCQLTNGIYEAVAILFVIPLIVSLGAGSGLAAGRAGRLCTFLGEISYPLYITHFPLICMLASWHGSHPDATNGQEIALSTGLFVLAVFNAWAALKLYDLPVRKWLSAVKEQNQT